MHGCHKHINLLKISWFELQMNGLGLRISNLHLLDMVLRGIIIPSKVDNWYVCV